MSSAAATSPAPSPKRRKINNNNNYNTGHHELDLSPSSFVDQFKSFSNGSPETAASSTVEEWCSSPASSPTSCCSSSNGFFIRFHQERKINFSDIEVDSVQVETSTCNSADELRRDHMSLSSEVRLKSQKVELIEKPTTQANSRCAVSMQKKMPKEYELEEFFTTAEKGIMKRLSDKYNYDIVKDVPLEGRYEWVQLKP